MLFLINESVFDLARTELSLPAAAHRYRRLSLEFVGTLGAELFAENPRLGKQEPERAMRLAVMIAATAPRINAAQFLAPERGCSPQTVGVRFETVAKSVLAGLWEKQQAGAVTAWLADSQVWRRLAA
jgi:hypothetical protein